MQIAAKQLNNAAVKKLTVTYFDLKNATAKAVNCTALLMFYSRLASKQKMSLTTENNIQLVEHVLQTNRRASTFCTRSYAQAIVKLRADRKFCDAYALEVLAAVQI
jgi:hypothetical protein